MFFTDTKGTQPMTSVAGIAGAAATWLGRETEGIRHGFMIRKTYIRTNLIRLDLIRKMAQGSPRSGPMRERDAHFNLNIHPEEGRWDLVGDSSQTSQSFDTE